MLAKNSRTDIDPHHNYLHRSLMHKNKLEQHHFSIQRHAVQRLLRLVLDAAPTPIAGFLGGNERTVHCILALCDIENIDAVRNTLLRWKQQKTCLLATYASSNEAAKELAAWQCEFFPETSVGNLMHLNIRTDTSGRIEAELHGKGTLHTDEIWPLEMQEDGGLYPASDNS